MYKAFLSVLEELLEFVFSGFKVPKIHNTLEIPADQKEVIPSAQVIKPTYTPLITSGQRGFIVALIVSVYTRPVVAFDTKLGTVSYGDEVRIEKAEGKFLLVTTALGVGWVEKEVVVYDDKLVFPIFESGLVYDSSSKETDRLRSFIGDECSGEELHLPLQSLEFILYKLKKQRIDFDWEGVRPRLPGSWQKILRGKRGVRGSVNPKTHAIMECFTAQQTGILAFVEEVHPDGSIVVESVGRESEGEFKRETLTPQEWRELRPVFITFE